MTQSVRVLSEDTIRKPRTGVANKLSRRGLMGFMGAGGPTAGMAPTARLAELPTRDQVTRVDFGISSPAPARTALAASPSPLPIGSVDDIRMLVNRTTQGFTEAAYAQASAMGYEGWLEYQLDYQSIDDSVLDSVLANFLTLDLTAPELYQQYGVPGDFGTPVNELRIAAPGRALLSNRQLYERMVEFWTDHFNIYHLHSQIVELLKTVDDREVIRAHALGNFRDMVRASAESGAMITYLDNLTNIVGAPNENYSRELMELHTLGVDGPYNENDVRELARCFTGWTLTGSPNNWGEFVFYPPYHDYGAKEVLGLTIPAGGGVTDAKSVIELILDHPSTATFVSRKMTAWMLGYDPPESLVDQVAQTYLSTGGDIKSMLRVILSRNHLMANVPFERRKLKRPTAFMVGLLRQTQPESIGGFDLIVQPFIMGHLPFNWGPPDGYPDTLDAWGGGVLPRWNLASQYLDNLLPDTQVSNQRLGTLVQGVPKNMWAQRIDQFMTGGALTSAERADVQAYIDPRPSSFALLREAIALVASAPSYQYY